MRTAFGTAVLCWLPRQSPGSTCEGREKGAGRGKAPKETAQGSRAGDGVKKQMTSSAHDGDVKLSRARLHLLG